MYIEPTITRVPSGFSGYIWFNTKIVFKKHIHPTHMGFHKHFLFTKNRGRGRSRGAANFDFA